MDIVQDLKQLIAKCEEMGRNRDEGPLFKACTELEKTVRDAHDAWSGSTLGHHASIYIDGLRPKRGNEVFDPEWGLEGSTGPWRQYGRREVIDELISRAKFKDIAIIEDPASEARKTFTQSKSEMLAIVDALRTSNGSDALTELRKELSELKPSLDRNVYIQEAVSSAAAAEMPVPYWPARRSLHT